MSTSKSVANAGDACSPSERRSTQRYRNEILGAGILYTVLVFVSLLIVERLPLGPARTAVALLPMAGVLAMALAIVRYAMRMDEFQRRTICAAGAIAAVVTAIVTMAQGFLENAGVPRVSMTFVWPLTAVTFGIAFAILHSRYR